MSWLSDPGPPEADDSPSTDESPSDMQSKTTSQCLLIHLTSFYHVSILSSHIIIKKGVSTVQKDIFRERPHSPNFYYSIVLVIVVNFILCLIYKLNLSTEMCV